MLLVWEQGHSKGCLTSGGHRFLDLRFSRACAACQLVVLRFLAQNYATFHLRCILIDGCPVSELDGPKQSRAQRAGQQREG